MRRSPLAVAMLAAVISSGASALDGRAQPADTEPPRIAADRRAYEEARAGAEDLEHHGRRPFGGLSTRAALRRNWSVNGFYARHVGVYPNQTPFWVIRRTTGGPSEITRTVWADSRVCPAVKAAFVSLAALPSPPARAPGLQEPGEVMIVADGVGHHLWTNVIYPSGHFGRMELSGNTSVPVALWWTQTVAALTDARCWQAAEPGV